MNRFRIFISRFLALFDGSRLERDMVEEIDSHLEFEIDRNIANGMSSSEAHKAAKRAFGGTEQIQEMERDVRSFRWVEDFIRDTRYGWRSLLRTPSFAIVSVFSLAVAIGVNCVAFTLFKGMFLHTQGSTDPERIMNVYNRNAVGEPKYRAFSYAEFSALENMKSVFNNVSSFQLSSVGVANRMDADMQRRLSYIVSENYFKVFGVQPTAGRFFSEEESQPEAGIPVVVVSPALWESLTGSPEFKTCDIYINGLPWTIIGVAPEGFSGGNALVGPDLWIPLGMASKVHQAFSNKQAVIDLRDSRNCSLYIQSSLRPDVSLKQARAKIALLAANLPPVPGAKVEEQQRMLEIEKFSRFSISTEPTSDGPLVYFGLTLLLMAGVVLLVACLNLANLFQARTTDRLDEFALRLALGATKTRVARMVQTEGLLVAIFGGAGGMLLSNIANSLLLHALHNSSGFASLGFRVTLDTSIDLRVVFATLIFSFIAAFLFSSASSRKLFKMADKGELLIGDKHSTTEGWNRIFSGRNILLMSQLALAVALVFCSGLFYRATHAVARFDPGFDPEGDVVAELDYKLKNWENPQIHASIIDLQDQLQSHPGIAQISLASQLPFGGVRQHTKVVEFGQNVGDQKMQVRGLWTSISSGYFSTLGVQLLAGRNFTDDEWRIGTGRKVVIIDEKVAESLFGESNPVGRFIIENDPDDPFEVVGVISAHWDTLFSSGPPKRLFFPFAQRPVDHVFFHIRKDPLHKDISNEWIETLRTQYFGRNSRIPLVQLLNYEGFLGDTIEVWSIRLVAVLFGVFGLVSLVLAIVGVYGVKVYMVAKRTWEFGIRIALGAKSSQLLYLVLGQGAVHLAIGLVIGILLALGFGRLLSGMLLRVSPNDPLVLLATIVPLAFVSMLACYLPARRALKIDPMVSLRSE